MASSDEDVVGGARHSKSDIAKVTNEAKSIMSIATAFVTQPFIVSRTLMQVNYEPIAPVEGVSLFTRKPSWYYPNTYKYLWKIKETEGLSSWFTGITPKLVNVFIGNAAESIATTVTRKVIPYTGEDAQFPQHKWGFKAVMYDVAVQCVSKSAVVVATQPLHVVMVRMVCSLVNKNEAYKGFFSSIKEIYNTEGLSGFFTGLVPRWIADMTSIAMTGTIMYAVYRVIENALEDETLTTSPNYHALVQFYVHGLVYKYQLTSTVIIAGCKGCNLNLPDYDSWRSCYSDLQLNGQFTRGQNMFYREAL